MAFSGRIAFGLRRESGQLVAFCHPRECRALMRVLTQFADHPKVDIEGDLLKLVCDHNGVIIRSQIVGAFKCPREKQLEIAEHLETVLKQDLSIIRRAIDALNSGELGIALMPAPSMAC